MRKLLFLLLACLSVAGVWAQGAKEAYTVFDGTNKLTFYYDDQKDSREGTVELLTKDDRLTSYANKVVYIVIDNSFRDYELTSTSDLFNNAKVMTFLEALIRISNLENINTAGVTDMSHMFQGMSFIKYLDLTALNTENVTNMSDMFTDCKSLLSVNLRSFDTKNVTDMSYMFYGCSALTNVDLSRFDFSNVTTTRHMFYNCSALKSVNMCNAHPGKLTDATYMFFGCNELEAVYCEENWTTNPSLTQKDGMFYECNKLTGDIGKFSHKPAMSYALFDDKNTVTYYNNMEYDKYRKNIVMLPISTDQFSDFNSFNTKTTKIVFDPSFQTSPLETSNYSFFATNISNYLLTYSNVTDVVGLQNINTMTMTELRYLFYSMRSLTKLDLSVMDLSPVTKTSDMFNGCKNLTTIICKQNLSGIPAANSYGMFYGCEKLVGGAGTAYEEAHMDAAYAHVDGGTSNPGYFTAPADLYGVIDDTKLTIYYDYDIVKNDGVTNWWEDYSITSKVMEVVFDASCDEARPTSTAQWFKGFTELRSITGIEYLHTDKVTDMSYMFNLCKMLDYLDLSAFNTENVTNMKCMFDGCNTLKTLRLGENFSTDNVINMNFMFRDCTALSVIPTETLNTDHVMSMTSMFESCKSVAYLNLSSFNTKNVTDMNAMFKGCDFLVTLDISKFDMTNVTDADKMFYDCDRLKYIIHDGNWSSLSGLASAALMFSGCTSLVGGEGTKYNDGHLDRSWARTDGGEGSEGYFCKNAPVIYATISDDGETMTIYYDCDMTKRGGKENWFLTTFATAKKIVFDISVADARPTSTARWFNYFVNVEEFEHMDYLNTEAVTDMAKMFNECHSVKALDLSNFKTGNVTNMESMFSYCYNLEDAALYNFDTRNVTNMNSMFCKCQSLTMLELFNFNTENVTDMSNMFARCSGLKTLDVTKFDTHNVTNMNSMFSACKALTTIDIRNFNIDKVTDMSQMFNGCSKLAYIVCDKDWTTSEAKSNNMFQECNNLRGEEGTKYDDQRKNITLARPDGGEGKEGYFCTHKPELYCLTTNEGKTMTLYYDARREEVGGETFWVAEEYRNTVTEIILDTTLVFYRVIDMSFWMSYFKELKEIKNLGYLNTSDVVNMMMAFEGCAKLESLDLSHFDTHRATSFGAMFKGCASLKSIDLTAFDFYKATDLTEMFSGCTALETVDLRTWHTSESNPLLTNMFEGCSSLKNIYWFADWSDLDSFYGDNMFKGCTSLNGDKGTAFSDAHSDNSWARLDGGPGKEGYFRLFDSKEAYTMYDASTTTLSFRNDNLRYFVKDAIYKDVQLQGEGSDYADDVTKVVFDESFAEVRPASTKKWFEYYAKLTDIEGIENLNTSDVTDMESMFYDCELLESIDLTHFDMGKVTSTNYMFYGCYKLKTIKCDTDWSRLNNLNNSDDLFYLCDALVGGKGTVYNSSYTDKTYARPDRGESAPGYFTGKPAFTVTLNATEGGKVTVAEKIDLTAVPDGTVLHITAKPVYGYVFANWSDEVTAAEREITVTSDITLTATFTEATFTLTVKVTPEEGGTVIVGGLNEGNTGLYMTEFTLEAVPNEGYEFDAWYADEMYLESAEAKTSSMLVGDMTMTCAFRKKGATGLDQITPFPSGEGRGEATKLLRNGILYIIRNGRTYDTTGRQLR